MNSNMPLVAMVYGLGLILIGAIGYFGTGAASPTALIPAGFGLIAMISGIVARNEALLKHAMHAAATVGLLGFLGTASSLLQLPSVFDGSAETPAAILAKAATAGLSLIFVVLCIFSFIAARKAREAGA